MVGGDLGRARQHFGVQVLELADFRLEVVQALRALLVPANLGIDVAHQLVELAHLGGGAIDDVALLLERRDLLGHAVGERFQRRELPLGLRGLRRGLRQLLECLADGCGA